MQKYIDFHTCPPVPLVVAHRGARGHAPENTLTAAAPSAMPFRPISGNSTPTIPKTANWW